MTNALENTPLSELLADLRRVEKELLRRGIVRSQNSAVADLAEHLACEALSLTRQGKSNRGYDATDDRGDRYEIKARRITSTNKSRQVSALRGLDERPFDYLIGVLFNEDYSPLRAVVVPHQTVLERSRFVPRTNSHKFTLPDQLWSLPETKDITDELKHAFST